MNRIRFIFPNLITLFNLLFGCVAIIVVFRGERGFDQFSAAWLIVIAAICDVFDGLVARALDARSEFGKELDSLADLVSFGVAPAMILFNWLLMTMEDPENFTLLSAGSREIMILTIPLLYVAANAIRLARFNVRQSASKGFTGLPVPAAAIIVCSFWLILGSGDFGSMMHSQLFVILLSLGLSALMVSNISMLSLKLSGVSFRENIFPYTLIIVGGILIILFWVKGIILAMGFYLGLSLTRYLVLLFKNSRR
ncbi:MAG: CDP-diacylglycerol--serine O-phosphatidyltransferase [Bacteroidales bacterium]|nr:CDP-diacylglycerol--serine O-phosphatidyltransferase [Bacteroidales bacterium]